MRSTSVMKSLLALMSTLTVVNSLVVEDSRMIAYLGNWQTCPTAAQLNEYTYIAVGFAVTYAYGGIQKPNLCSQTCEIATPALCSNSPSPGTLQGWQSQGKKVLLSFGGAGMGGSWAGELNNCWDYCFGREEAVVDRLVQIVSEGGYDGVDIDYEYFYDNNHENAVERGFTLGPEAIKFLKDVTIGLRQKLPSGSIVTHAPMDVDLLPGTGYFNVLKEVAFALDFLMPQYYNGVTRAHRDGFYSGGEGDMSAAKHYSDLVNQVFGGDATRVVFGFCINDCTVTGSNADSSQTVAVMEELTNEYPCHGGAFFWVAEDDVGGEWSRTVNDSMDDIRGCIHPPTKPPTQAPFGTFVSPPPAGTTNTGNQNVPPFNNGVPNFYDPNNSYTSGAGVQQMVMTMMMVPSAILLALLMWK